jgi:murein DD-endopeptidase MepM/ murein hydrolase activator NlpD
MRIDVAAFFAACLTISGVSTRASAEIELRFCPSAQVRTFPLESQRDVQSLLLQNVAIINAAQAAAEVTAVELELRREGTVIDTRRLSPADIARAAASGAALQKSGMLRALAFQFCGSDLIDAGTTLGGATLAHGQALLISQQPFAYRGKRDELRVRAHVRVNGQDEETAATLPIVSGVAKSAFHFPLEGVWFAAVGPTMHTGHRWALPEEFAYDIAKLGQGGLSHRASRTRFTDYFAYGATVLAAADGVVVTAMDDQQENSAMLRGPKESEAAYGERVQKMQADLLTRGARGIAGNYVVIDHGSGEYSVYAHLQPGSVRVKAGNRVTRGAPLGKLGSSGNSTEPHLHFQVCDSPDALSCAGIPVDFQNVTLPYADYPRPLQSGDILLAK